MGSMPFGAGTEPTAVQGTPEGTVAPPQDQAAATPQIDWDSDDNLYKQRLAEREAELQRISSQYNQLQSVARDYANQELERQRQERISRLDREYEDGNLSGEAYRQALQREADERVNAIKQQAQAALMPLWVQEYAGQQGLSAEEAKELQGIPAEAVEWTIQRIKADRDRNKKFQDELDQLKRSIEARQVVNEGVTRTAGGTGGGAAPGDFPKGSLAHLRAALAEAGQMDLIGPRS